jgi:putative radical SAM enzyme (TIGR03279 family)
VGLRPGDRLVAINGHVLRDVIDYYFYAADERLELEIERAGERLAFLVDREYGEDLGVRFTEDVFDGVRRCRNGCAFCFVDQMPPGLRPSLYVKDDDYRLSFLHGNFVTLSNWTEEDWHRVEEQHLSPLYISVHSTDLETRRRLLCNPRIPNILPQLRRLAALGIEMHAQIVVVPGWNDGDRLEETVSDLTGLFPAVRSIGVVPVGLTKYHRGQLRLLTVEEEGRIVEAIGHWQGANRDRLGVALVYASDELYLRTGHNVPLAEEYAGFPQLENGIGLVRQLLDEGEALSATCTGTPGRGKAALVCGTLIAPTLRSVCQELQERTGLDITVLPVPNEFFGRTVTVSGLLTAGDVMSALEGQDVGEVVFVPRSMFEAAGRVTLDDVTRKEIEASLQVEVVAAGGLTTVVGRLTGESLACAQL